MGTSETPVEWHSTLPVGLYTAIGRVAHSTALLDAMLGEFAEHLTGSLETWVFVSGQSTEWLLQMCRVLLDMADPQQDRYPTEFREEIRQRFERASELRNLRNRVIHGTWSRVPFDEQPLRRPWGNSSPGKVYWVARDRQRRGAEEQEMTVADVDRLADEIDQVAAGIIRAWRSVTPHKPDWPPFRRWHSLGFDTEEG